MSFNAFQIPLPAPIGNITFSKIEDFTNFAERERDFWSWLEIPSRTDQRLAKIYNQIQSNIQSLLNIAAQLTAHVDQQHIFVQHLDQYKNILNNFYASKPNLHSSSSEAIFAKNLSSTNPQLAGYVVYAMFPMAIEPGLPVTVEGAFRLFRFRAGDESSLEAERSALENLKADFNSQLTAHKTEIISLQQDRTLIKDQFNELHQKQEDEFQASLESSQTDLENIEKTYDEKLALHSSVRYWKNKKKYHSTMARRFGFAAILATVVVAILILNEMLQILTPKMLESKQNTLIFGVLAVSVFLGVWVIRILVQLFLSNVHLENDSNERVTMIQAYLALIRDGSGPADNQRELILQTLFRPSPSGLVKDDFAPPFLWDWLTKTKKL